MNEITIKWGQDVLWTHIWLPERVKAMDKILSIFNMTSGAGMERMHQQWMHNTLKIKERTYMNATRK